MVPSPARQVLHALTETGVEGDILIRGSFGHEWQYESALLIRKYRSGVLDGAGAVVCLDPCDGMVAPWQKLQWMSTDVWVRR